MDDGLVTIKLPEHAVRYLRSMIKSERKLLSEMALETFGLSAVAAADSLNALELALPSE